jgi:hypothetical protein
VRLVISLMLSSTVWTNNIEKVEEYGASENISDLHAYLIGKL